jgi:hypothetical protein
MDVKKGGDRMDTAITLLITSAASVFSGTVLFLIQRFFKNQQRKDEEREKDKATQTALILKSLNALGKLTVANSIALRDGKTNGELKSALTEYEVVEKELYEYLISTHN